MRAPSDGAVAAVLGLGLALLYAALSSPSYGAGDSPQHALSALTLGVSRPPGYPLYVFLARAWAGLFGAGALGAFSGACEAAGAAALYLALREQGCRTAAALFGALLCALSPLHWYYAQVPEVRALNHALALGALLAVLRWRRSGSTGAAVGAGALVGLGLGHHPTFVFVLPSLGLAASGRAPARGQLVRFAWAAAAGLIAPYAALRLRLAMGAPAYNPDAVATWRDVLALWLREDSGGLARVVPRGGAAPTRGLTTYAGWLAGAMARDATWFGAGLAAYGLSDLARREPRRAALWACWLILGAVGYAAPAAGQLGLIDPDYHRAVAERFFALPLIGLFALAAFGAEALARRVRPALLWALAAAAAARGAVAPIDLRAHEPLRDYARAALAQTKPGDVIIPAGDDLAFALTHADIVERSVGARVVLMPWLFGYAPYVDALRARHPELRLPLKEGKLDSDLASWRKANPKRAFYLEGVQSPLAAALGGGPDGVLAGVGLPAAPQEAARAFLDTPLGRLERDKVIEFSQETFLLADARALAAWHLSRVGRRDPELRSRLILVLSGL